MDHEASACLQQAYKMPAILNFASLPGPNHLFSPQLQSSTQASSSQPFFACLNHTNSDGATFPLLSFQFAVNSIARPQLVKLDQSVIPLRPDELQYC